MPPFDANERNSKLCFLSLCQFIVEIHYHLQCHNFTYNTFDIKLYLFPWFHKVVLTSEMPSLDANERESKLGLTSLSQYIV